MLGMHTAHGLEAWTTSLIFQNPACRKCAILNLLQNLLHLSTSMIVDHTWTRHIIAKFGSVADRVAHIIHATLVHQVYNQLHFMHTLKVGHLWLIASIHQRLEAGANQRGNTATQHCLFAK